MQERLPKFYISNIGQEMLKLQDDLAKRYKYKVQPHNIAEQNMAKYLYTLPDEMKIALPSYNVPIGLTIPGKQTDLISKDGILFATGYDRIVIGHYGAFLEIDEKDMIMDNVIVKRGQEYRMNDPKYSEHVKYYWYTTNDCSDIKLYYQQKSVSYADYQPNKWYVSPFEVCNEKERDYFKNYPREIINDIPEKEIEMENKEEPERE